MGHPTDGDPVEGRPVLPYLPGKRKKPIYMNLTFQVLVAIAIGILIGAINPAAGKALKPLGDGFIRLIKMVVGPIIFLTIVLGIVKMGDLKKVGRVGVKAILYFEIVTTIALLIGLIVANVLKPGVGVDTSKAGQADIQQYVQQAQKQTIPQFLLSVIPENVVGAFATGDLLQILFFSMLFGTALASLGMRGSGFVRGMEQVTETMFRVIGMVMRLAPLGAGGAMAYTVGAFGVGALVNLAKLMACVYTTMAVFIFIVLGLICRYFGFSLLRFLNYIREEILLALGTSSSESVLPRMIERLEVLGCGRAVVGMVIPAGYSFNMDGTSIYLSMASVFIAQAFGIQMSFGHQLELLLILMLTSKGSAGVTGAGFITLAATLTATHVLPVEGLGLLIGVDRFMSEARTITNLIGNGVATVVVSKMEGEFDQRKYDAAMAGHPIINADTPEAAADLLREPVGSAVESSQV